MEAENLATQVKMLRDWYPYLSNDERLELFSMVTEGYCKHCGTEGADCQCWNDE